MAYNAIDIAKKIIVRTDTERGDSISNLKLQKLLYYMQGFHLAFFGTPLFNEEVQAWAYGPVVPVVYNEFRKYKGQTINPEKFTDTLELQPEEQTVFDNVYNEYSQYSAIGLMNLTHEDGPWKSHEIGDVITCEEMRAFFLTQIARDAQAQA